MTYRPPGYPAGHAPLPCDGPRCPCRAAFLREAARDARERGKPAMADELAARAYHEEPRVVPYVEVDRETLADGTQPIRLSRSIRVF